MQTPMVLSYAGVQWLRVHRDGFGAKADWLDKWNEVCDRMEQHVRADAVMGPQAVIRQSGRHQLGPRPGVPMFGRVYSH